MGETDSVEPATPSGRERANGGRASKGAVLVLVAAAALLLWNLGGHDLWAPDEPYFGEGAREMVVDGQWVVPHVNGVVTTDKPPLFFWSIAILSLPFGEVTPWTARLPSALAGLALLLIVMRIGRRFGGERVGVLAVVILTTTLMFWVEARAAQIDALLCLLIWVALAAFLAWRAGEVEGRGAGLVFWAAAALAVLAKGPVGLLLPLGIALVALAVERRLGSWREFAPLTGPLLFAVIVGAWVLAASTAHAHLAGGGEYTVWGALREHFVDRAVHGMHHKQPPWYYLHVLPVQLLPWSALVPGAVLLAWRRRSSTDRFLLAAALFVVAFFTVSTEKRNLYVLPAFPAFALMTASFADRVFAAGGGDVARPALVGRRWFSVAQGVLGALVTLVGLALPFAARGREEVPYWMALVLAAVFLAGGVVTLWAVLRGRERLAFVAPAVAFGVAYLFAATSVFPALEGRKSARAFSLELAARTASWRAAGHRLMAFDLSNLPEAFAFYTDGVYTETTDSPAALTRFLEQPGEQWAVVDGDALDELPAGLRSRVAVVAETTLSRRPVALIVTRPAGDAPTADSGSDPAPQP